MFTARVSKFRFLTLAFVSAAILAAQNSLAHPTPEIISPEVAECFGQSSRKYEEITPALEKSLIAECNEKVKTLAPPEEVKVEVERETSGPPVASGWQTLFSDDFEKSLALSWNFFGDWSIKKDNTNVLEIGGEQPFYTSAGAESWTDYKLSFKYKPLKDDETANLRIKFRIDWSHNIYYSFKLSPVEKQLILEKFTGEKAMVLQQAPFEFQLDSWKNFEITAAEDKIWVFADGIPVMSLKDPENPLLFGRIGIEAEFTKAPIARIDDFKIIGVFEKPTWEHLGAPFGGKVAKILIYPQNPNNVLLTSEHASVYKSTDGGKTWKSAFKGLNTVDLLVKSLAMSPRDSKIVLAMSSDGPYRTIDQGEVWRKMSKITSPDNSVVRGSG
ncbi:MAG TPA: hypothetical protein VJB62_01890, partial [Patescibacteria group bacterium]|nr:hypothetical protein [Patescibacteria group bacterium]